MLTYNSDINYNLNM